MKFFEAIKVYGDPKAITNWLSAFSEGGSAIGENRIVPIPSTPSDPNEYQILCDDLRTSIVRKARGVMVDFASPRAVLSSFLVAWREEAVIAQALPFGSTNSGQKRTIETAEIDFIEDVVVVESLFTIAGREWYLDFADGPALIDPIGLVIADAATGANGGQRSAAHLNLPEQGALAGKRNKAVTWLLTEGRARHNLALLTKDKLIALLIKECDLPTKNSAKEVLKTARKDGRWDPAWSKPGPRRKGA